MGQAISGGRRADLAVKPALKPPIRPGVLAEQRLNDMLGALDWIAKAVSGRTEADFLADETLCYAIAQKLTIIGEAVAAAATCRPYLDRG